MSHKHLLKEMTINQDVVPPEAEVDVEVDSTKTHNVIGPYGYWTWKQPLLSEKQLGHTMSY